MASRILDAVTISPDLQPAPLLLRRVPRGPLRKPAADLLASSGRSERFAREWCDEAEVFALCDPAADVDEAPAAALLAVALGTGLTCEVRVVAVAPEHRGRRLGSRLLVEAGNMLRAQGVRRLVASAANTDINLMWLFQRVGFRFSHVERDGCLPERGWVTGEPVDGIEPRDVIWFDQVL